MKKIILFVIFSFILFALKAQEKVELKIQAGHSAEVLSLAFSSDERFLASMSQDLTIKIWDIQTGLEIKTLSWDNMMGSPGTQINFSPNGQYLVTAANNQHIVWNLGNGVPKIEINGLADIETSVNPATQTCVFSPDGKYIFAGACGVENFYLIRYETEAIFNHLRKPNNEDENVEVKIETWEGHTAKINALLITNDGKKVISAGDDAQIIVWDVESGKKLKTIAEAPESEIWNMALSGDNQTLMYYNYNRGDSKGGLNFLNLNTGKIIKRQLEFYANPITSFDKYLIFENRNSIAFYNIKTHKIDFTIPTKLSSVKSIVISKSENYMGIGNYWGDIEVWDIKNKRLFRTFKKRTQDILKAIWLEKNQTLALATRPEYPKSNMSIWNLQNKAGYIQFFKLKKPYYDMAGVHFSMSGDAQEEKILTNSDSSLFIHEAHTGKVIWEKKILHSIKPTLAPNSQKIAYQNDNYELCILDINTNQIEKIGKIKKTISDIAFNPQHNLVAFSEYSGLNIHLADLTNHKIIKTLNYGLTDEPDMTDLQYASVDCIKFSPDGKKIAAGCQSLDETEIGIIVVWEVETGKRLCWQMVHDGEINAIDWSPDSQYIVTGCQDNKVGIWQVKKLLEEEYYADDKLFLNHHNSPVTFVVFTKNNRWLLTGSDDGKLVISEAKTYQEIATLMLLNEDDYLMMTKDGYYTCSNGTIKQISFLKNNQIYLFDQFDLQYNRPDIVLERIGLAPKELIDTYKKAYEKRLKKQGFKPENFEKERSFNVPEIKLPKITNYYSQTQSADYQLDIEIEDKLFNLDRLNIWVNGVPIFGAKGKDLTNKKAQKTTENVKFKLSQGKNILEISAMNEKGVESLKERLEIDYTATKKTTSKLYLINIGASKYQNAQMNLNYAQKDAQDIAQAFQNKKDLFQEVISYTLVNEQVTKENVANLKAKLLQTQVDDYVMITFSGHGLLDENKDYYLATHNINFSKPQENGLLYEDLESLLDGIPARHKILLMDACHSGEVDKDENLSIKDYTLSADNQIKGVIKARNFNSQSEKEQNKNKVQDENKTTQTQEENIDLDFDIATAKMPLPTSFELMKELFTDLRRTSGATVISAAGGAEFALEGTDWNNGVFTYALLSGLKEMKADLNKDGMIMLSEIKNYVQKTVPELTGGRQQPTSRIENLVNDFRVW